MEIRASVECLLLLYEGPWLASSQIPINRPQPAASAYFDPNISRQPNGLKERSGRGFNIVNNQSQMEDQG
jgi:hypothetical protein